jgi:single-strand DNA-binding protein
MNRVTLFGNVGKDPEVRVTNDGTKIATLTLATSERWKDRGTGEAKERTEWHRIVVFGGQAEVIEKYVKKGDKLLVEGSIQTRKWVDQAGVEKYTTEIKLQAFDFGGGPKSSQGPAAAAGGQRPIKSKLPSQSTLDDDEVPF